MTSQPDVGTLIIASPGGENRAEQAIDLRVVGMASSRRSAPFRVTRSWPN